MAMAAAARHLRGRLPTSLFPSAGGRSPAAVSNMSTAVAGAQPAAEGGLLRVFISCVPVVNVYYAYYFFNMTRRKYAWLEVEDNLKAEIKARKKKRDKLLGRRISYY